VERVYLDVGCYKGAWTDQITSVQHDNNYTIHALEPDPTNLAPLVRKYLSNSHVKVHGCGAGETSGRFIFHIMNHSTCSSFLPLTGDHNHIEKLTAPIGCQPLKHHSSHEVQVVSLEKFMADHEISEIEELKIDTQGLDLAVVKGLGPRLPHVKRIHLECWLDNERSVYEGECKCEDCIEFLTSRGFEVTHRRSQKDSTDLCDDITFTRKETS
jgi:FkbM family methyltransferase